MYEQNAGFETMANLTTAEAVGRQVMAGASRLLASALLSQNQGQPRAGRNTSGRLNPGSGLGNGFFYR